VEQAGVEVMANGLYDAQSRIQVLLEYLHDRQVDLEDMAEQKRLKLEQCVQLRQFEIEAKQVRDRNGGRASLHFDKIIIPCT
jgi:hypothetical protein